MNRTLALALVLLALPLHAAAEPTAAELQANRARLERWRKHPAELARLRRYAQAFEELPEARRAQVLALDRALREEPSAVQARLGDVLDRYAHWLETLPADGRGRVAGAPDKASRLVVIQELRDRQWMQTQPRALREHWARLPAAERPGFVGSLRRDAQQRRQEWQVATRFWKELDGKQPLPARLADFEASAQTVIREYLMPQLSAEAKHQLEKAEGRWPAYPTTLVAIADRHPFALPGLLGPRRFSELPHAVQVRLTSPKTKEPPPRLRDADGWPKLAITVVEITLKRKQNNVLPHELWASNHASLLAPMQEYLKNALMPVLTDAEKLRLKHAENKWPKYPLTIRDLARAHHVPAPPWHTALPGPRERWDRYRVLRTKDTLPELPRRTLHDFAAFALSAEERAGLDLSPGDPGSLRRLREAYFRHHPDELDRLQRIDRKVQEHLPAPLHPAAK